MTVEYKPDRPQLEEELDNLRKELVEITQRIEDVEEEIREQSDEFEQYIMRRGKRELDQIAHQAMTVDPEDINSNREFKARYQGVKRFAFKAQENRQELDALIQTKAEKEAQIIRTEREIEETQTHG